MKNFVCENVNDYLKLVWSYFNKYNESSVIQVDSLLLLYKMTHDERTFALIFKVHKIMMNYIVKKKFFQYKSNLFPDDLIDLQCMAYEEFYRRVLFYETPPRSPFSKYVKDYLTQWVNAYIKLMCKKNSKIVLNCDSEKEIDNDT